MKSRWNDVEARAAVDRRRPACCEDLALRLYSARLIGSDPNLVLHGGGNVSVKGTFRTRLGDAVDAIRVKASGFDLATLEPDGLPVMDLAYLRRFRNVETLTDDAMVNEFRRALFDTTAATPSIEAFVHAFLPHKYVDHSHADAVLAVTNHANGAELAREAMGEKVGILPYVRPGFDLARAIADMIEKQPELEGIVLLWHGLVTFGDDARTSYERHIALVDACERFLQSHASRHSTAIAASRKDEDKASRTATRIAPLLRGLLASPTGNEDQPYRRLLMEWRCDDEWLGALASEEAGRIANAGPLTGDHLIRTRPWPLFVNRMTSDDDDEIRTTLQKAIDSYTHGYRTYASKFGATEPVDALPRVVFIEGAGLFAFGPTKKDACIAADIAEHTVRTIQQSQVLGPYQALDLEHLFDMEFRGLQRVKLDADRQRPLERLVVVISGGAGAIGAAVADSCLQAGAHACLADLDEQRLTPVVQRLQEKYGAGAVFGVTMDVTSEESVRDGYERIVRNFGGVDVIVPNAGIAHVASVDELAVADFRRVMEVNAVGYLLFMQEGIRILKRQGLGGHIVINASKNVFGPGKDFGAYSASKAAGHQLGKVAAIELAPHNIRVNMINADAVFGDGATPSGLWATVGPERAKSRKMDEKDLPEYYRQRNLLKARVLGRHVGNAVIFFASNATPTTGATLPVDGGVVEAFPR